MDDEEYARRLFEILSRPLDPDEPVDPYGTLTDRIDRSSGFGTDVRVASIDVVPGEHGNQIAVGFVLDVPAGTDVPPEGTVLLPVAAEWREAQGYLEPASYAPWAASGLMRGVGRHIDSHRGQSEPVVVPDRETQRALLHDVLGREGDVAEAATGRFVVRRTGSDELTVLVTPDQWEQVVRRHGPRRSWLLEHFSELLASRARDDSFLVFWEGDLVRSTREQLPPVSGHLRALMAMQAEGPAHPRGTWYAYRPDAGVG